MLQILAKPTVSALIAMIFYGSWAAFANIDYGHRAILNAFLIQGSFALSSTLLAGHMALFLMRKFRSLPLYQLCVFAVTMAMLFLIPFTLHSYFLTPNILKAMAPGMVVGSIYIGFLLKAHSPTVDSDLHSDTN